MENERDSDTNYIWFTRNGPQSIDKETGKFGNWWRGGNYTNYSIAKIN